MKMITKRGIFLWILSGLFIVGLVLMTVSLVTNGNDWVMKRFNSHVYSDGELIGAGTIFGITILGTWYQPMILVILPPGAFIVLGLLMGGLNKIQEGRK